MSGPQCSSGTEYAYRFEYADGSAFEVYADGRAFIATKDGRREQKFGRIDNRIPLLIGMSAKPRQDEIDRLRTAAQAQPMPDRDQLAEIVFQSAHKGLKNCWQWSDPDFDHEHPGRRGYYYKIADGILSALSSTDREGK